MSVLFSCFLVVGLLLMLFFFYCAINAIIVAIKEARSKKPEPNKMYPHTSKHSRKEKNETVRRRR
jgi:hypothetical protein